MKKQLQYNYDARYDVLYISVVPNESAIGVEDNDGIVIRKSRETGEFVGLTIFDFKMRLAGNSFPGVSDFIDLGFLQTVK